MTTNGKGAFINDVSKDRLWRDYVSREENHQNYWAVEAQFVKGSLSPDKKNILRAVDSLTEFDPSSLLGTARGSQPSSPTARFGGTTSSSVIGNGSVLNPNPNAPSNLLLRQLHMTAAENAQAEAKQLEQLQSFKHNYSTRAGQLKDAEAKEAKREEGSAKLSPLSDQKGRVNSDASLSPLSNRQTPLSPNATMGAASTASLRYPSELQKERTLNNNYCSYYAGKDIGIHHYKYSPPASSCQGLVDANSATAHEEGGSLNNTVTSNLIGSGSLSRHTSASPNSPHTNKKSLPPLATHLLQSQSALPPLEGSPMSTTRRWMSPVNTSRVYHEELEEEARLVSPKRHYTEHGLLQPMMGRRVAGTTAHRGYGQRIASSHEVAFAVRPTVELNERSTHGYRKW